MATTTIQGNGWEVKMDDLFAKVVIHCQERDEVIDVNLMDEMPAGKDAADLRILLTKNTNVDGAELIYQLNEFFTGSR